MKVSMLFMFAHTSHALLFKSYEPVNQAPVDKNAPVNENVEHVFENIAKSNTWGSAESISGPGSEIATTAPARVCLGNWIKKYKVGFFMDIPCGDANWQGSIPGIDSIKYQGYDIAQPAVTKAQSDNQEHRGMTFGHFDLTSGVPPGKPDLFMVRDVIQHLPLEMGRNMLVNAKKSGAKYLVVSSFTGTGSNQDIYQGSFYENDVHKAPFNMPAAEEDCDNYAQESGWFLGQNGFTRSRLELIDLSKWTP